MKLRITIDGKAYEVDVEILDGESAPEYPPYPPATSPYVAADFPEGMIPAEPPDMSADDGGCRSPVSGIVIKVEVAPGQSVRSNDVLMFVESMKMEMQITATHDAVVKSVQVSEGASVKVNQMLVEFE